MRWWHQLRLHQMARAHDGGWLCGCGRRWMGGVMMSSMRLATVAVVALLLTSCGGGGGDTESPSVESGQDVADMVGCSGFKGDSEEMYVTEGGGCDLDGQDVYVYYFSENDRRDDWVKVASQFGGPYLVGDGWVMDAKPGVLDDVRAEHGGELSD